MHAFAEEALIIIEALNEAKDKIRSINNPEINPLKARLLGVLSRESNALATQLGVPVEDEDFKQIKSAPLTKMFGRELKPTAEAPTPFVRKTAQQVEDEEYSQRVAEIYPLFLAAPADDLLDTCSDLEIRGVAKKAGLPVTIDNPKRITSAYIEEIKAAMRLQLHVKEQGNVGSGETEEDQEQGSGDGGFTEGSTGNVHDTGNDTGNETGNSIDNDAVLLKQLEDQLVKLREEKAHYTKIKAVEKQIADLKESRSN